MTEYIESIDTKMSVQDTVIADKFNEIDETLENKFNEQDTNIENAIEYMKDNIVQTATNIINRAIENGDLNVGFEYNSTTEELDFIVTREGD